jgi:hypothetical protein
MGNLLRIPNTAVTDVRVISTSDILTITYTSTSAVRIVYKVTNNPSLTLAGSATVGAVILTLSLSTSDSSYASHDVIVNAISLSNSANSNPNVVFVCPELPGARTVATAYTAPIATS